MIDVLNFLLFSCIFATVYLQDAPVLYDAFFGKPVTERRGNYLAGIVNATSLCTVPVRPCRPDEGRRVDGTCTNPHYPSRGATLTPFPRLLPSQFGPDYRLPPAKDGSDLPSARLIRTTLLGDGFFVGHHFSVLVTHFHEASVGDNVDLFYLTRYGIINICCAGNRPNYVNPMCIPIPVPEDDPYLRPSGIRCLNLTRVETYQDYGCLPPTLPPERYNRAPPLLDLSFIYGNTDRRNREIRANEGGFLAFEMEGDREIPAGQSPFCINNRPPEVRCYNFAAAYDANLLPGALLIAMWFFREHNRIARRLALINPCWDDEKLFQTAREINIAQFQYIYYYELTTEIIGRKNALLEGIIYDTTGYVNDFDPRYEPGVYQEFMVGTRFFHNYKPGAIDLYRNGVYRGSRVQPDDILRMGIFSINNTEADLTEGALIQPAAKFDYVIDAEVSSKVCDQLTGASLPLMDICDSRYGNVHNLKDLESDYRMLLSLSIMEIRVQSFHEKVYIFDSKLLSQRFTSTLRAADLPATDIMRGRDAGFQSYNQYRRVCGLKVAKEWEDFHDTIDKDKVESLRRLYDHIDDVELMIAIYVEKLLPGAYVGPTLYCIMVQNLLLWRKSDKFFFEHGGFPAALTIPQLNEIRMANMARILCDNGDDITHIQPRAFLKIGKGNKMVPCSEIVQVNLNMWKDNWCPEKEATVLPQK